MKQNEKENEQQFVKINPNLHMKSWSPNETQRKINNEERPHTSQAILVKSRKKILDNK